MHRPYPTAHPAPATTPDYVWRGRGHFETYREELEYLGGGRWLIPSGSSTSGKLYEVRVGSPRRPERSRCECRGFASHKHCSHIVCATEAHEKSVVCDACRERRSWPELVEVQEEDELLAWYPGDVLCRPCVRHHWS